MVIVMDVRPSPIAGRWYPAKPAALARILDQYLARVQAPLPRGRLVGLIVPHAGLRYSGPVAAHAFACVRQLRPELVAIVGPMHTPVPAALVTTAHDAYATPFGPIMVDWQAVARLDNEVRAHLGAGLLPIRNDREHAIEIELPFLQHLLGSFRLLPVMIRDQRAHVAELLGHALAAALAGRPALLVASSDLSHYYPQATAQALDAAVLDQLAAFDPHGVIVAGTGVACGSGALAAALWAARGLGADQVSVVRYGTSAEITGDNDAVVGYGAALIWQSDAAAST
jgi:MEMO1 family protein